MKTFFRRRTNKAEIESSDEWSWGMLEQVGSDLRYAFRSLLRNPAYALTAILTLALGIGANAAIFNLLNAVILRTLPVPDAEQLRLFSVVGPQKDAESIFSYPVLREMQAATTGKAGLTAFSSISPMKLIAGKSEAERTSAQLVSGNFFEVLGVKAQAGHLFAASDDGLTGAYPAVLSDAYWSKRFAREASVIGESVSLNDTPVTIVGVATSNFSGLLPGSRPDFWLPVSAQNDLRFKRNVWNSNGDFTKPFLPQPEIRWLSIVARLDGLRNEPSTLVAVNQIYARDMQREVKGRTDDPQGARDQLQTRIQLEAGDKGLGDLRRKFTAPLTVLMSAAG